MISGGVADPGPASFNGESGGVVEGVAAPQAQAFRPDKGRPRSTDVINEFTKLDVAGIWATARLSQFNELMANSVNSG